MDQGSNLIPQQFWRTIRLKNARLDTFNGGFWVWDIRSCKVGRLAFAHHYEFELYMAQNKCATGDTTPVSGVI